MTGYEYFLFAFWGLHCVYTHFKVKALEAKLQDTRHELSLLMPRQRWPADMARMMQQYQEPTR